MKNSILNHKNVLFFLVAILIPLGTPISFSDYYIITIFIYSILLFIYYKNRFDKFIIVILGLWGIINFFAMQLNDTSFNFYTFWGTTIKILLPYFSIKVIGWSLINKISSTVYYLTIITLPIHLLRIVYPQIFELFNSLFEPLTADFLKGQGWYSFIYTYNRTTIRNSGFMWEPGAYAMMLNIAILNFMCNNGFRLDRRLIVLLIALLTTLSTMGFFSLLVFFILILNNSKNYKLVYFVVPLLIIFAQEIYNLEFISGKITDYVENLNKYYFRVEAESYKVNRFSMFLISLRETYAYPFGYGVVKSNFVMENFGSDVKGVGAISGILRMWGVVGLLFFIFSIYRYYNLITNNKKLVFSILATIVILFSFFSNPVEKSPILYFIIYYPYIYVKMYG